MLRRGPDEFHCHKISQAGQFFLSVGNKRTELAQAVESGARQDLAGGVNAPGEALPTETKSGVRPYLRNRNSPSYHAQDWILVAQYGRVGGAAHFVRCLQIFLGKADAAVIHEDDLVTEAAVLYWPSFQRAHGLGKGAGVVDGDGHHLVQLVFLRGCVEVRPQAAQRSAPAP